MQITRERVAELLDRAGLGSVSPASAVAVGAVCLLALGYGVWRWWPDARSLRGESAYAVRESPQERRPPVDEAPSGSSAAGVASSSTPALPVSVYVHVTGEVEHPDIYELPADSRVADAIDAAGGMTRDALSTGVNLARKVSDGEQILVPDKHAIAPPPATPGVGVAAAQAPSPVNINTAVESDLDELPGIGPSTAQKILIDRETNGPFKSIEDLGRVPGIGPKRLEQLKPLVCVQ